jgi:hypothetical protein
MKNILSPDLQQEELECGSCGLNSRQSPGQSATAVPILGKAKYHRISGVGNWRRQKFLQFYLNYPYIL